MNAKAWLDLLRISVMLTAGTMLVVTLAFAVTGRWIDVFYPFALLGCLLALHRLNKQRRRIHQQDKEV